jgi:hypothetical protein
MSRTVLTRDTDYMDNASSRTPNVLGCTNNIA